MRRRSVVMLLLAAVAAVAFVWNGWFDNAPGTGSGEHIAIRFELATVNLNPRTVADVESRKVQTLLHSGLVAVHQDGRVVPRLASSWEQVAPNTIRFKLRSDVRFSDGTVVDAKAVVASLCEGMQPTVFWSFALSMIERKLSADGKSIVCTGLSAPAADELSITTSKETPKYLFDVLDSPAGWILKSGEKPGEFGKRLGLVLT